MRQLSWPDGGRAATLGVGTWRLGESASRRVAEVAALRSALDLGVRLVDTAEMYGDGGAETVVGEAFAQALRDGVCVRDDVCVVSKAYPHHAGRRELPLACERSLRRLRLDHLDVYLLHWRGDVPLAETVEAMERLRERGRIRRWGVSNFDVADLDELVAAGGAACCTNQVYYSLGRRGVEFDLLPWQRQRAMPLMAYCPLDQGELAHDPALRPLAERHGATPAQVALAWVLAQPGVIAIPKAASPEHLRRNVEAARLELTSDDLAELDRLFPPPRSKQPLAIV
jgi:diketogulonate reductase-like aldo/keto reductase